jgi:nucleotide-binding universal stress UspA family protein
MTSTMNILIGYDGSECADAALRELTRAGLPSEARSVVLTIADVWPPPPPGAEDDLSDLDPGIRGRVLELWEADKKVLVEAGNTAAQAARNVRATFPSWNVRSRASADSPAGGILKEADEWLADLIVLGSHGMSVTERLLIGSVSQRVMTHASCSVRVARERKESNCGPLRLIVGFDGSTDAEAAVLEVASRSWPKHTDVRVLTVMDQRMLSAIASRTLRLRSSLEGADKDDHEAWLHRMTQRATDRLNAAELRATSVIIHGQPKQALLESARQWDADAIFVGATGLTGLRRLLIGSVSSAVTAHAPCTVEVVRPRRFGESA